MRRATLNVALSGMVIASGVLSGCSRAQTKDEKEPGNPTPSVRINLSTYSLPRDFFRPEAEKCASQIIGYRFVAWLNSDSVIVGFNTSPYCRSAPDRKVNGSARLLVFGASGDLKVQHDVPYLADGNGEIVAEGEARPGPSGTILFRVQSVNLDEQGRNESKSAVLLFDQSLKEVGRLERFLEQTTFVDHALVFQDGFTTGNVRTYSLFGDVPLTQKKQWQQTWPMDARDRKFGEHGVAFMACQQELRPNEYVSTGVVYAGAKQRCTMTEQGDDQQSWTARLPDGETASIIGLLADGSVVGNINKAGSNAGRLVIWRKDQATEDLPWIPDKYCGSVEGATAGMARYAVFASDNCHDLGGILGLLGVGHSATDTGRWLVFDRKSQKVLVDRPFPKNGRAALSPDGVRYATFEAGELRIYSLLH
jgi:hypothetical protein